MRRHRVSRQLVATVACITLTAGCATPPTKPVAPSTVGAVPGAPATVTPAPPPVVDAPAPLPPLPPVSIGPRPSQTEPPPPASRLPGPALPPGTPDIKVMPPPAFMESQTPSAGAPAPSRPSTPSTPPTAGPPPARPDGAPGAVRPDGQPGAVRPDGTPGVPPVRPDGPPGRGRFVVLNFDNADIETVVHAASEIIGFNYVLAPDVRGKVTVQTSGRIPQEDVFGVLLAILEVHGFTAVKSGNLYKVVRIEGARERAVPTIVGLDSDSRTTDEIITQIIPVRFSSVADLANLLRPLISGRGNLIAHRETNVLVVTDAASNVKRVLEIIRLVDVEIALDELQIVPVRFADAADLATILNQLFASGRLRRAATPGAPPTLPGTLVPPTAPGTPRPVAAPGGPAASTDTSSGGERPPMIIAERRSNSLIIHARRTELETVRKLIGQLDVNIYSGRRVFVYYAENAKAKDLAATLNSIYGARDTSAGATASAQPAVPRPGQPTPPPPPPPPPPPSGAPGGPLGGVGNLSEVGLIEGQVRFIADETTNAIIVTTFPRNWTEIEATIKQLDKMPRQVLIEVLVAEITLTDDLRLGVDWAVRSGKFTAASQNISTASPPTIPSIGNIPIGASQAFTPPFPGLTAFAFSTNEFMALLNTMASTNRVNVLSSPHVLTVENKKAVINVSDSIPIVTSQQVPIGGTTQSTTGTTADQAIVGTQSVEYRDAGVVLTVTPRIGERGTVALDVKQEVNDVGEAVAPTGSPRIIKREAETSVVLMNNQTLVLGGLIKDQLSTQNRGVPFFKDIPILGYLFGAKVRTVTKTELLLLITPRVIGTVRDAGNVTDDLRKFSPQIDDTLRKAPTPPETSPGSGEPVPSVPNGPSAPPAPLAPPGR